MGCLFPLRQPTITYFSKKEESHLKGVILVFGGPGVGKTTQCLKLVEQFGFGYISYEDITKEKRSSKPQLNINIDEASNLSNQRSVFLLEEVKKQNKPVTLIEGFPREMSDLNDWKDNVKGKLSVNCFLYLYCDKNNMKSRVKAKNEANLDFDAINERMDNYERNSGPLLEICQRELKMISIETQDSPDAVYSYIYSEIEGCNFKKLH